MRSGTYIYKDSFYHRFDDRAKLIFTLLFSIALIASPSFYPALSMMLLSILLLLFSVGFKESLLNFKRILLLVIFIIIFSPFQKRDAESIISIGSFMLISRDSLFSSVMILFKFIGISFIFSLLLETERIEDIVRALRYFHISYSASLTISMTLSLIPALSYRYSEIREAIELRKGKTELSTLFPSLVSLIVSAVKLIPENASLLEERGFTGEERPSYRSYSMNGFIFTQMLLSVIIPLAFFLWR